MQHSPDGRAGVLYEILQNRLGKRLHSWWLPLGLIAGGCIATTLHGQTGGVFGRDAKVLEPEKTIQGELAGGQSHEYQFHLRAGEYARVLVEQRSVDVAVACVGPGGQELFAADSHVIGDAESVEVTGEVPGAYRLRITASDPHAPSGRYEITLRDIGAATERHKMRIAAARAFAAGMNSRRTGTREAFVQAIGQVEQALAHWRAAQDRIQEAISVYDWLALYRGR